MDASHSSGLDVGGLGRASEDIPAVTLEQITRRFDKVEALARVNLRIRQGEFFSLLGPSGCGKTTLLRVIAGLDWPDEGRLLIHGQDAHSIPAHRRPVNTVFQSYALFPHLTVWENVAFGLRMKKVPVEELEPRVRHGMEIVEIAALAQRKPSQLSGGQRQRVALARAIVNEPKVLLLDEPLGALDLKLRRQLQVELRQLQQRLGITFVYVTHDQEEAMVMSDRIAVMNNGRVEQLGACHEIYEQPRTRFVAQFLGSCNLLDAVVKQRDAQSVWVDTSVGRLRVDLKSQSTGTASLDRFTLAVRPEKICFGPRNGHLRENEVHATVENWVYGGAETQYSLRVGEAPLRTRALNLQPGSQQGVSVGQPVSVVLPPAGLIVLED
jgi:spermidine/putrescine transport system ATP-binding protein